MSGRKLKLTNYLFITPHLVMFIVFFLIPTIYGIFASFTKWNLFNDPVMVGFDNYRIILLQSESTFYKQFWNGLGNTVLFVVLCVPLQILLPLSLAVALSTNPRGKFFFQSVFYIPTLFSITSVILTWLFIFNRSLGLFNNMFHTDINWYGQQPYAWMSVVIVTLWWVIGGNLIIYIAALAGVDKELLEAGEIDGASSIKKFFYITIPSIRFPLVFTIITSVISQFNIYGQPLLLTDKSKPIPSVTVLLIYIRDLAFGTGNPVAGVSSAMSTCLGLVIGTVAIVQTVVLNKNP